MNDSVYLKLPATSPNLGPGFDTMGLALALYLEIQAAPAADFKIEASGRNAETCTALERNLLLDAYRTTLRANGKDPAPLSLQVQNEIPIGMGCGSSAAARLAGVTLASYFGDLQWRRERILAEACLLEGHPDNVAACWMGGFTLSAMENGEVHTITLSAPEAWEAMLVLPEQPLSTSRARGVLPERYSREDSVANIQHAGLLTAAFATGRGDLLRFAMQDRIHQPYRGHLCPLLPVLAPLAGSEGILGVALSGAGPGILLLIDRDVRVTARAAVQKTIRNTEAQVLSVGFANEPALVRAVVAAGRV